MKSRCYLNEKAIKELRIEQHIKSFAKLCELSDVKQKYLYMTKSKRGKMYVSIDTAYNIAETLKCDIKSIVIQEKKDNFY